MKSLIKQQLEERRRRELIQAEEAGKYATSSENSSWIKIHAYQNRIIDLSTSSTGNAAAEKSGQYLVQTPNNHVDEKVQECEAAQRRREYKAELDKQIQLRDQINQNGFDCMDKNELAINKI